MQEKQEPLPGLLYEAKLSLYGSPKDEEKQLPRGCESRLLGGYDDDSYYDSSFAEQVSPLLSMKSAEPGSGATDGKQKSDDTTTTPYNTSIKLGLGDFCFYSVLVGKIGNSHHPSLLLFMC